MDKYRREISIEILVGLFLFAVLITLGVFTIVLSHENLMKKTYHYEFVFSEVAGLRDGDNVYVRGMNVGRVKQIGLEEGMVHVYASLDVPMHFRKGYKVEVVDSSMLGGKFLKIYAGPANAPELPENTVLKGVPPTDMVADLAATASSIKKIVEEVGQGKGTLGKLVTDDGLYNNLDSASASIAKIVSRLEQGKGSIGKLLVCDDGKMYDDLRATMRNLRTVTDNLAQGKGMLGHLVSSDDAAYQNLQDTLANLRTITADLADGKGTLGKLIVEDDSTYADLHATLASIRSISESISEGKGTLGRLVRDAQLYDQATLLVEDIRAAVDDLREASPVTSFGSVLFGAF